MFYLHSIDSSSESFSLCNTPVLSLRKHNWKVFETAKAAKKAGHDRLSTSSLGVPGSASQSMLGIGEESGAETASVSARSSMYFSDADGESGVSDGYGGDLESLYGYV